jgi:hypothetical protein
MEQNLLELMKDGFLEVFNKANWIFVAIFVILTWLLNIGTDHPSNFKWLNWMQKISKPIRAFFFGLLLSVPFVWLYGLATKTDYAGILYGIFIGMGIWKLGPDWVFKIIIKKFFPGAAIPDKPADQPVNP